MSQSTYILLPTVDEQILKLDTVLAEA